MWGRREKGQREERRELSTRGLQMLRIPWAWTFLQTKKKKRKGRKTRYYKINNLNVWSIKIIILAQSIFHKALSGLKVIFDMDTGAKHLKCTIIPNFLFSQKIFLFKSQCVFSSCLLRSTVWSKDSQGTKYILIRTLGAGISEIQLYQTDAIPGSDSFI